MDQILFRPSLESARGSPLMKFVQFCIDRCWNAAPAAAAAAAAPHPTALPLMQLRMEDDPVAYHDAIHRWSVSDMEGFWSLLWQYLELNNLAGCTGQECISNAHDFLQVKFFPHVQVNYAETMLRKCTDDKHRDKVALVSRGEEGLQPAGALWVPRRTMTYGQLHDAVARLAHTLRHKLGLKKMDRVVSMLPNGPEALVALLAVTSIGAVWSSVAQELSKKVILDRFSQVTPVIMFVSEYYTFGGKLFSTAETVEYMVEHIPTLHTVINMDFVHFGDGQQAGVQAATVAGGFGADGVRTVTAQSARDCFAGLKRLVQSEPERFCGEKRVLSFERDIMMAEEEASIVPVPELVYEMVSVQHPVFIMFTSGTTGAPKCIVQGYGALLNHIKELHLHHSIDARDVVFVYTNCGWMMWNHTIAGLALGSTLVLFDGSPVFPDKYCQWRICAEEKATFFGTSSRYLSVIANMGVKLQGDGDELHLDLSHLRMMHTTGSPLAPAVAVYIYKHIKSDIHLASISGGTEINGCFALGSPLLPVRPAELQTAGYGMNVQVWDDDGKPIVDRNGELVCLNPFPSAPLYFWNDEGNRRYIESYFSVFDNVWTHGDLAERNKHGGFYIKGRSDSTLNPGGVRIGTADFYGAMEFVDEVLDSIVIGQRQPDGNEDVILFVQLKHGFELTKQLRDKIHGTIRKHLSPRHRPSEMCQCSAVPFNVNGKKMEKLVKKLCNRDAVKPQEIATLKNPEVIDEFKPENWNRGTSEVQG